MSKATPPASFHDPAPRKDYAKLVRDAKATATASAQVPDRLGNMSGTPSFDKTDRSWDTRSAPKGQLSSQTTAGLAAIRPREPESVPPEQPVQEQSEAPVLEPSENSEIQKVGADEQEDVRLRKAVEARITDRIDLGQYLMNGEVTQAVPIIPGKLVVTFRSVTDLEEAFVDVKLAQNREMTTREFVRKSNEFALALHISEVNGTRWPAPITDGKMNEAAVERRLSHVQKLSSPVFQLITKNLGWFLDRVNKALTLEALGNG